MKKRISYALVLALVLAGAVFAVSCGGGGGGSAGGTIAVYSGDPSFIDPSQVFESEGIQIANVLFDPLLRYDYKTLAIVPGVAESYEASDDATVWTFHLKKGTKFHNGREVVAGDFKYSWERLSNPDMANGYGTLLNMVKGYQDYWDKKATEISGIKAVDDYTLEITMAQSFAEFDYIAAFVDLSPLPKEEIEGKAEQFAQMPIGNGPFKMAEPWVAGQYVKVVKFEDYTTADKPKLDGIDFKIYSDLNTAWTDFQAGALDWTVIPPGNYKSAVATYGVSDDGYTSNPGKQVQNGTELSIYELLFNMTDPIMQNKDLRIAISLAINRQAICDTVYEGTRKPATSVIPPAIEGYEEGAFPYCKYDVEGAKAALARAGYPEGAGLPVLKLTFNSGAGHDEVMQLVKSDLDVIGIKTEFETSDGPTYWSKVQADQFQIGRSGWACDYPTMDDYIAPLYESTGFLNYCNYNSPEVDAALKAARTVVDKAERIKAYQAIVRTIGEDCPDTILNVYAHERVTSARVHDFTYNSMVLIDFTKVWLEQ
jgi:oligopeptide transport system substrate-binding protein